MFSDPFSQSGPFSPQRAVLTDAIVIKQIKESTARIATTYKHLQQGLDWVRGRVNENGSKCVGWMSV